MVAVPTGYIVAFALRLCTWEVPLPLRDRGNTGSTEILVKPLHPPRSPDQAAHPVSWMVNLEAANLPPEANTDGTALAGQHQVPVSEGARSSTNTPRLRAQAPMYVPRIYLPDQRP